MEAHDPSARRRSRRIRIALGLTGVVVFFVAALIWRQTSSAGPESIRRYLSGWEPARSSGGDLVPFSADHQKLVSEIEAADVPLLVAALSREEGRRQGFAVRHWNSIPARLRNLFPTPVPAWIIRDRALDVLRLSLRGNGVNADAVTGALARNFETVPVPLRPELLLLLARSNSMDVTLPVLATALKASDLRQRLAAVQAVLDLGSAGVATLPAVIASLEEIEDRAGEMPVAWGGLARRLGRLGFAADAAAPLLNRLALHETPEIHAEAALARWRVQAAREPAGEFLCGQLARLGPRGLVIFTSAWFEEKEQVGILAVDALPVLARLLECGVRAGCGPCHPPIHENLAFPAAGEVWSKAPVYPSGPPSVVVRESACALTGAYGEQARTLAPALAALRTNANESIREAASQALIRIGAE